MMSSCARPEIAEGTMLSLSSLRLAELDGPQLALLSLLALPILYLLVRTFTSSASSRPPVSDAVQTVLDAKEDDAPKSIMQPENSDLLPPRDDPYTQAQLKDFDGSDPSKPIYVSIKGASALSFDLPSSESSSHVCITFPADT